MKEAFNFKSLNVSYYSLVAIASVILFLVYLGFWQLERRDQKLSLISSIEQNLRSEASSVDQLSKVPLYSKVKLTGEFVNHDSISLYGYRSGFVKKHGYYLLTPFRSDNGSVYLVSRGWFNNNQDIKTMDYFWGSGKQTITAITMKGEKASIFSPQNSEKMWFYIDVDSAKDQLGVTEDNFYLMQIENITLPEGAHSLSGNKLSRLRNDHMEYAITWFCLAFAAFVIFARSVYVRSKVSEERC